MTDKQKKVKAILEKLQNLQGLLVQRYKIEQELEEIPKAILKDKEVLVRLKKQLEDESEVLEKRQVKVKDLRFQLHDAEDKRLHYEKNMEDAKTQKEYEVLDKAIKESILEEQQLRKDLLKEEKETAEQSMRVESHQKLIDGQAEEIRQKEEKIQSISDAKKQELGAVRAKIQDVLDKERSFCSSSSVSSRAAEKVLYLSVYWWIKIRRIKRKRPKMARERRRSRHLSAPNATWCFQYSL